ncbi:MAG: hypothetical protein IT454_12255 [Planctomycetes bacterium]|nr:hypothetical protein [Planctomycetota bacterium]
MSHVRAACSFLATAAALSHTALAQSIPDSTGLTALRQRLGAVNVPSGVSVIVGQVEANAPGWAPDAAHLEFAGKSFTMVSPTPTISGHATAVGQYYYGLSTGIAPGIASVLCWEAIHFLGTGFINGTGPTPPKIAAFKVLNNSWIGAVGNSNFYLRKLDYAIDSQGLLVCSGVNNGTGPLDVPLLSHSYNGLAVGRSDGQHHAGPTMVGVDGAGRMKPEIVAPAGATSFSTPLISGACSLLVDTARTWPSLATNPSAERPEVIKAALLAGATHRPGWSNNPATSGATRGSTSTPMDALWGCDQVNVDKSHWILTGGEHASDASAATASTVSPQGWEEVQTTSGASRFWRFSVESVKPYVSIVATWNRHLGTTYTTFSLPNLDLELWSIDAQGNLSALVGTSAGQFFAGGNVLSASGVDNLEHLYVSDLQPGEYALELRRSSDVHPAWNAAVAWEFACAEPVVFGVGKTNTLGQEARIATRGIPSESAGDFHLSISHAMPGANGIVFYGSTQASIPFHGGTRYVASPIQRSAIQTCGAAGELDFPVAIDASMPGTTRIYQFWYRDASHPDGTGVGLTNAVRVTFCR